MKVLGRVERTVPRWNVLKYRDRWRGEESWSSSEWTENQSNGNGRVSDKLSRSLNEQQRSRCIREITAESVKDLLTERHCEIEVTRQSRPRTMLANLFRSPSSTRFFVRLKLFANDMLFASQTTFETRRSTHTHTKKKKKDAANNSIEQGLSYSGHKIWTSLPSFFSIPIIVGQISIMWNERNRNRLRLAESRIKLDAITTSNLRVRCYNRI